MLALYEFNQQTVTDEYKFSILFVLNFILTVLSILIRSYFLYTVAVVFVNVVRVVVLTDVVLFF